jgi:hypothetical protein
MTGFSALPVEESPEELDETRWSGTSRIVGPRWARLPIITVSFLGVQFFWSVELSYGEQQHILVSSWLNTKSNLEASPYLLSLGLTKSLMAIVFVAGPLSGLIVQPLVGKSVGRPKGHPFRKMHQRDIVAMVEVPIPFVWYRRPILNIGFNPIFKSVYLSRKAFSLSYFPRYPG